MKRRRSNPLALAVLAQLCERPMHPYEIAAQMRSRGVEVNIKLNYGSLYSVVDVLQREGLIVPQEVSRSGRLPERTVYTITEEGRAELLSWLRDLVRTPVKEYTHFAAGLSFLGLLQPAEAVELFEERARLLEAQVQEHRSRLHDYLAQGLPRLFLIEDEHGLILQEAEIVWLRRLIADLRDGTFAVRKEGKLVWKALLELGYVVTEEGTVREAWDAFRAAQVQDTQGLRSDRGGREP
ncbi:MAG TPA: PadR family transcriptional regulator [Chloroflexota bacterium]|jgi:DNA-binding PadR family transcriptional regulator